MNSTSEPLCILAETLNYVIVDKPYDICINGEQELVTHGRTVASVLSDQRPNLVDNHVCSGFRFPHQLDYATSGALCITLNKKTTSEAVRLFKERRVEKEYLALVHGHVTEEVQVVKSMIGEDSSDITGFVMTSDKAKCLNPKAAETRMKVLAQGYYEGKAASKLAIQPITGRRHQIRVHCLELGHPIIGDYTYSGKTDTKPHRMMLHAWRLKIPFEVDPVNVTTVDSFGPLFVINRL